ncbi:MAG: hypothetical protein V4598_18015 [Bdellovibrionota bacterium]
MIKLPVKDLAKRKIADGHVYLSTSEGRKFYLLKPGMLLDEDFIKKHAQLNTVFDFEPVAVPEVIENFSKLFKELRYLQFERDLKSQSLKILGEFHDFHSRDGHFLSFAQACFDAFNLIPHESLKKMHSQDTQLFRKSFYSAAFSVAIALSNDFYHFTMLRDFYNISLMLDFGLCETNYSYYVAQACNQENKLPGSGRYWLEQEKATKQEIDVFLGHPKKSYDYLKKTKFLAFPELAEAVLYQHELSNGNGFPKGIPRSYVSGWEAVIMIADSLVEISDDFPFESRVIDHLMHFQSSKLKELPVGKVHFKLKETLKYFDSLKETNFG